MDEQCWNTIGVRGDRSCPELRTHIHCRNCPVYTAAGGALLEAAASPDDISRSTAHVAEPTHAEDPGTRAVMIFSVGGEWLAVPTAVVSEVLALAPIHTIPHRGRAIVFGVVNVRGELVPCASLGRVLGLPDPPDGVAHPAGCRRLLVIRHGESRVACPVDDVHGIHRFHERHLHGLPSTLEKAGRRLSCGLLSWKDRSVGLIDEDVLCQTLKRSVT